MFRPEQAAGGQVQDPTVRLRSDRPGAVLVLVAVTITVLAGLLALGIDGGLLQHQKRVAQLAADAAVKAGAIEILRSRPESVSASATSEAARNGFVNGTGGRVVTITYPSTDATFTGVKFVQVTVRDSVPALFSRLWGRTKIAVNARSIGGVTGTNSACISSLAGTVKQALLVHSGGQVTAQGCNVSVNSNNAEALRVADNNTKLIANGISVTGGYFFAGGGGSTLTPNPPTTGAAPAVDPLSGYVTIQPSDTSGTCLKSGLYTPPGGAITTLNPGNYCGGIKVAGQTTTARLNAGIYVIKGGGFEISSRGTVIGNGPVTIINLADSTGSNFKVFNLASAGSIQLSAPTSGRFSNILFYSPPNQNPGKVSLNRIHSDATATINGSFYFPDQNMEFSSGGALTINGGIIASMIEFGSDARVTVTGFAGSSPYAVQKASLVQ